VVSVLASGPNGRGFKPGRGDGFLRVIKFRSTTSFGLEVKPSAPCREIFRNVEDPLRYDRETYLQTSRAFLVKFIPASLLGVSAATRAENSGG
jgi:hypothetical protein